MLVIEPTVVNKLGPRSPTSFKHVSSLCAFFDAHFNQTTPQYIGVQLRQVTKLCSLTLNQEVKVIGIHVVAV